MRGWYSRMVAIGLGLTVLGVPGRVMAQEEIIPTARVVDVDWPEVSQGVLALAPELRALPQSLAAKLLPDINRQFDSFAFADKDKLRPLALLNVVMTGVDPSIARVPIPVLLPVDTPRYMAEFARLRGTPPKAPRAFFSPAISNMQLLSKTTGYDVILTVDPSLLRRSKVSAKLVQIHLGGAGLLYDGGGSGGDIQKGGAVDDKALQDTYPRLRRTVSGDGVTYSFVKYGVPYFANMLCTNAPPSPTEAPCADVEGILQTVLRDLRLVGGAPLPIPHVTGAVSPRPTTISPSFTYYAPGNLLPGTSQGGLRGVTQKMLWGGDLLFPVELAPAFAMSQVFMHAGNCLNRQNPLGNGRYECAQNPGKILEPREDTAENYSYPWRDNYCEERNDTSRHPWDCPARDNAHEGQDIRPRECRYDGTRCTIDLFDVIAVTDGSAWWKPDNNVRFAAADGGFYYTYLHMSTDALKRAGLVQGQWVTRTRGQRIGEVGNWDHTTPFGEGTAHLHFEIRRKDDTTCGEYACTVSPYWTLIRAYERLIGAQGTELP